MKRTEKREKLQYKMAIMNTEEKKNRINEKQHCSH
jgi:hypothetical protein